MNNPTPKFPHEPDIIKTYGPYSLVARHLNGVPTGVLKSGETGSVRTKLLEVTAASNQEAIDLLEQHVFGLCEAAAQASPEQDKVTGAWKRIWPQMSDNQVAMVKALHRGKLSTLQLAGVADYKDHRGVNRWLGEVGFKMFLEAPRKLLNSEKSRGGDTIFTFALCTGDGRDPQDGAWVWSMRPEVARGLELAHLVAEA